MITPAHPDTPIAVQGYVTDPHRVGYQLLTNYESTYWRALVGLEAWSLYEVLRSFCHQGSERCTPSLQLLMDILGITERRRLTGRVTTIRGERREFPGLIDQLQSAGLVAVETVGEGPKLSYVFHLNLTPDALSAEQLTKLPASLQRRHGTLMKRMAGNAAKIAAMTKRANPGTDAKAPPGTVPPPPPGTVPPKHYPYSITQKEEHNNNSTPTREEREGVVVSQPSSPPENNTPKPKSTAKGERAALVEQLMAHKVGKRKAVQFAATLEPVYLAAKLDILRWKLTEEKGAEPVRDQAAWLIHAIEEDYQPPDGYKSPEKRAREQQEAQEHRLAAEEQRAMVERREEQRRQLQLACEAERIRELQRTYGTSDVDLMTWSKIIDFMASQDHAFYAMWLANTTLLTVRDGTAMIGVPSAFHGERLKARATMASLTSLLRSYGMEAHDLACTVVSHAAHENGTPARL